MAMNKREREEVSNLHKRIVLMKCEVAKSRAFVRPTFAKPEPIPQPDRFDDVIDGWWFIPHNREVRQGWQRGGVFYTQDPRVKHASGSRQRERLYATEQDAYRAMIYELVEQWSLLLAQFYQKAGVDLVPDFKEEEAKEKGMVTP